MNQWKLSLIRAAARTLTAAEELVAATTPDNQEVIGPIVSALLDSARKILDQVQGTSTPMPPATEPGNGPQAEGTPAHRPRR